MSKDYDYIKGLEDLAGNPYNIFKGQNPIDAILGEGSIINPRKLEIYIGIKDLGRPIRLVLPEIFKNQQPKPSDWHIIYGEHGETIVTLSKPPFNPEDIKYPLISVTGEYCLTSEDLDYFRELRDKRERHLVREKTDYKRLDYIVFGETDKAKKL